MQKNSNKPLISTRMLAFLGLMVALNVVLTEAAKLMPFANIVRVSLSFIPLAACAVLYGPVPAGIAGALADILSFFIFPDGPYFPGFTFSAFIAGVLYALPLYRKRPSVLRSFLASLLVVAVVDIGLNTVWLTMIIPGKTFWALLLPRGIKSLIMLPVETAVIFPLWRAVLRIKNRRAG